MSHFLEEYAGNLGIKERPHSCSAQSLWKLNDTFFLADWSF